MIINLLYNKNQSTFSYSYSTFWVSYPELRLIVKGANEEQKSRIGNQTGGRVFLFLHTDNFKRDYQNLIDNNVKIVREPSFEDYGTVAVFEDLYGNLWDLIEPKKPRDISI